MKLLFITRKYPPMVGGMEKVSYSLANELSGQVDTTVISWGKSQKFLPLIIPYFFIKSLFIIPKKGITHIHFGDALLTPMGVLLKLLFHKKTSVTVHGLDITFAFPGYQWIISKSLKKMDRIICASNATKYECIKRGIPDDLCIFIPWGVYPDQFQAVSSLPYQKGIKIILYFSDSSRTSIIPAISEINL